MNNFHFHQLLQTKDPKYAKDKDGKDNNNNIFQPKNKVKLSSSMFDNNHKNMSIFMHKLPNLVYNEEKKEKVMLMDAKSSSEINFIEFKTNIIMKFAKSFNIFNHLPSYFENLSDVNKHYIKDCYYKLKVLLEKRENVLFDFEKLITNFNLVNNLEKWKNYLDVFYNFEILMEKMVDTTFKEHKQYVTECNLKQKIIEEKDIELNTKNKEIERLKKFIDDNNLNYKSKNKQSKTSEKGTLISEYEKKDRLNQINIFRLEEE